MATCKHMDYPKVSFKPNKALLSDKFSAVLQICRRARRYVPKMRKI